MDLTDEQWAVIAPLLVDKPRLRYGKVDGRGRPRVDAREVWNGILWILRTGAPWHDLPDRYPPYQTCHRRMQEYSRAGTYKRVLIALAEDLHERGGLDLSETFIDGTFAPAKKGGGTWGLPVGAKARRSWQLQTALVFLSPSAQKVLRRTK
jgi:transposase